MFRYFLQPHKNQDKVSSIYLDDNGLSSLRLKIHYTVDHVFPSHMYDELRSLLLQSPAVQVFVMVYLEIVCNLAVLQNI